MILGIDLGTTYSVGAYIDNSNKPQIISNSEGSKLTPSVVLFENENEIVVGDIAKENSIIRPGDVISVVKNYMGKQCVLKECGGQKYNPEMISSFIIKKVISDAEKCTGTSVDGVVVTVPAYFTDAQRKATEDAVTMAGAMLVGMINEPTAAAISYVKSSDITNETLLVYDLGGGTFDVTVIEVNDSGDVNVKATGGISNTGGRFFDQAIVDYVVEHFDNEYEIDLEEDEYEAELQELYLKAENVKQQLSIKQEANLLLKVDKHRENIAFTRAQFENMISRFYLRTEAKIKDVLKNSSMDVSDIDRVILIGGSSRIPYICEQLKDFTNKEPVFNINPDEAVAIGAAYYGVSLESSSSKVNLIDVCSHSLGVAVTTASGNRENEILIKRNTELPAENEQQFQTMSDGQKRIELTITEGEFVELSDVTIISNLSVLLPDNVKANDIVNIKVGLDKKQLIYVKIELPKLNFEQDYKINRIANMSDEKIEEVTGFLRRCVVK